MIVLSVSLNLMYAPLSEENKIKPLSLEQSSAPRLNGSGIACVDELRWNSFHEGKDLITQVESYRQRYGYYPEKVLADPLYGTRENRHYLKEKGIHYARKPLGRPKKDTLANKAELKQLKSNAMPTMYNAFQ